MKKFIAIFFFVSGIYANAQPALQWAKNIGGTRGDEIKVDAAGNVYTTGYFSSVGDFDPGPGTFFLTAASGGASESYVSKLDANGNFLWAVRLGGGNGNLNFSIEVDAVGNVYTVGYFSGTADFDPGPAVFNLTSNGQYDVGISKLDANGNFVWAKNVGGTTSDLVYSVVINQNGSICLTGNFAGLVDFDPGPSVFNLNGDGVFAECFILCLSAAGDFIWAREIDGNYSVGSNVTKDAVGNLYVCGVYDLTADLDPGAGVFSVTTSNGTDAFVIKLDAGGNFIWGKSFGGPGSQTCESVKTDAAGNVFLTGYFPLTADFDPGVGVFAMTALGTSDAFVLKLDASGNFVWAKAFSGSGADNANDIAVDATGNSYITGLFQNTTDFDPGPGVFNLTAFSNDIYIAKLDAAGNFGWAIRFGGATLDAGLSVFAGEMGNIYATGFFAGAVDFDPGAGITTLFSSTGQTFIVNLGGAVLPLTLLEFFGKETVAGNLLNWKTAQEINTKDFEIEWSGNGLHFTKIAVLPSAGNSTQELSYNYLHKTPADGANYYRLKMQDIDGRFTYSPIIKIIVVTNAFSVTVFPNPVINYVQLYMKAPKNEMILLTLHSADGKMILSKQFAVTKGNNLLKWDVQFVSAGSYFISSSNIPLPTINIIKK
jgi:hypothetical protein